MASPDSKDRASTGGAANAGAASSSSHPGSPHPGGHEDSPDDRRLRERLEKLLPDIVRRAINVGTTAFSTTEDGIRKLVSDFNLPRDVAAYLVMQATASKDEALRIFGSEVRHFLETVNLSGELQKLLTSLSFEVKTEIRFIPNSESVVKPEIKNKVAVKRDREGT